MPDIGPPHPRKEFNRVTQFNNVRLDPYRWMRDDNWQEVLENPRVLKDEIREHLEAENNYFADYEKQFKDLEDNVAAEMRGRIIQNESTVPQRDGDWEYWREFRPGGNYAMQMRRNLADGRTQTLFDGDKESVGSKFFNAPLFSHSPDHKMSAYGVDREGSEYFDLRFRDNDTGLDLPEVIKHADPRVVWSKDSSMVYYCETDDNHRATKVKCHALGTDPKNDVTVYEEPDMTFELSVDESQSGDYIFISSDESDTTEVRVLRTDAPPGAAPTLIAPRQTGHRYYLDHHDNDFYIRTNRDGATNFKLMKASVNAPGQENWIDVVPYDPATTIAGVVALKDFLVREEYHNALPRVIVSDYHGNEYALKFPGQAYSADVLEGFEYDTDSLRISYQTPAMPGKIYDVNLRTQAETLRREKILPNGHDPDDYLVERKNITARDGTDVPVTILRRKDTPADGTAPLYLYGYGSYGANIDANFVNRSISLADRGVIYAIAHIRGGGEKGESWYLDGKMDKKQNTFNDFIDAAEGLAAQGYGKRGGIVIEGRSAGGLLMGAVLNQAPEGLFAGAVAGVPFVDVMNTMSDESLPLTPGEWTEWGNPITDEKAYRRMRAYSPYDNIDPNKKYPPILATGSLADFRVTYWEPAKWIARLRDEAQGGPFFLKTNMNGGHAGSAARFTRLDEDATLVAFALHRFEEAGYDLRLVGKPSPPPAAGFSPRPGLAP